MKSNISEALKARNPTNVIVAYTKETFGNRLLSYYLAMRRYSAIKELLKETDSDIALDLGCGIGEYGKTIKCRNLISLDFNKQELTHAKGLRVQGDAEHLPFRTNTFNFILFTETLEHLQHPQDAIGEVSRCLKPNDTLIISTPSRNSIFERQYLTYFKELVVYMAKRFIRHTKYETPHIHLWLPNKLKKDLYRQGLKVTAETYQGFCPPFTGEILSLLFRNKRFQTIYEKLDSMVNNSKRMQSFNWTIIFTCQKK